MTTGHASATGPTVTLVQLPNGQTVQVHGVIQAAQPSVIQSPQVQAVQVTCNSSFRGFLFSHNIQKMKFQSLFHAFLSGLFISVLRTQILLYF